MHLIVMSGSLCWRCKYIAMLAYPEEGDQDNLFDDMEEENPPCNVHNALETNDLINEKWKW